MRNKQLTILKALGIIFVVMGHKYDPSRWFPTYGFHMALFFFASGYFYKETYEENVFAYIVKRIKKVIPLYFGFNLFYFIVTYILYKKYKFILGSPFSLKSFFITPFVNGHQFYLFLAAWFMISLLIIQIVFVILHKYLKKVIKNIHINLIIFILIGISSTYISKKVPFTGDSIILVLIKTLFGMCFYYIGFYYKKNEHREIFSSFKVALAMILQVVIITNFKNITYVLAFGQFKGHIFMPIIISMNSIYLYLFISKVLAKALKDNDVLYKIGSHTASVMFHHLFVFYIINYIILKITNGDRSQLKNVWYAYQVNYYWLIYVVLGVFIPVYLAELYGMIKQRVSIKNILPKKIILKN